MYCLTSLSPQVFEANFSTTTATDRLVSQLILMSSVQKYFNFDTYIACGIPEVRERSTNRRAYNNHQDLKITTGLRGSDDWLIIPKGRAQPIGGLQINTRVRGSDDWLIIPRLFTKWEKAGKGARNPSEISERCWVSVRSILLWIIPVINFPWYESSLVWIGPATKCPLRLVSL